MKIGKYSPSRHKPSPPPPTPVSSIHHHSIHCIYKNKIMTLYYKKINEITINQYVDTNPDSGWTDIF